jgi:hypothetical protein
MRGQLRIAGEIADSSMISVAEETGLGAFYLSTGYREVPLMTGNRILTALLETEGGLIARFLMRAAYGPRRSDLLRFPGFPVPGEREWTFPLSGTG